MTKKSPTETVDKWSDLFFTDHPEPSKNRIRAWLYAVQPGLTSFSSDGKTGKWCIFRKTNEIDQAWELIKQGCVSGHILVAKVATVSQAMGHESHVICVYTRDYEDKEDVMKVREYLSSLGFTEELGYKRDIDTQNKVYGTAKEWFYKK